jgi:hypothetical protein
MKRLKMPFFLVLLFLLLAGPGNPVKAANIQQFTDVPISEIQLRNALELERAAMQYLLCFEAWTEARRSKKPSVKSNLVSFMRNYRRAYANFLFMLRQDNLYDPQKPKNPAGWFNMKHASVNLGKIRVWSKTDAKAMRKQVKDLVDNGAQPEQVVSFIESSLPQTSLSYIPYTTTTTSLTSTTSSPFTSVSSSSSRSSGSPTAPSPTFVPPPFRNPTFAPPGNPTPMPENEGEDEGEDEGGE